MLLLIVMNNMINIHSILLLQGHLVLMEHYLKLILIFNSQMLKINIPLLMMEWLISIWKIKKNRKILLIHSNLISIKSNPNVLHFNSSSRKLLSKKLSYKLENIIYWDKRKDSQENLLKNLSKNRSYKNKIIFRPCRSLLI